MYRKNVVVVDEGGAGHVSSLMEGFKWCQDTKQPATIIVMPGQYVASIVRYLRSLVPIIILCFDCFDLVLLICK